MRRQRTHKNLKVKSFSWEFLVFSLFWDHSWYKCSTNHRVWQTHTYLWYLMFEVFFTKGSFSLYHVSFPHFIKNGVVVVWYMIVNWDRKKPHSMNTSPHFPPSCTFHQQKNNFSCNQKKIWLSLIRTIWKMKIKPVAKFGPWAHWFLISPLAVAMRQ